MSDKNILEEQYCLGGRFFSKLSLERIDLENIFLSRIEMTQGNLNYANLKNADLSDADLTESSLIGAELGKAHLTGINLSNANLSNADLTESILTQANFGKARLKKTSLMSAVLIEADLSGADLSGADLSGADLSKANLKGAFYDDDTTFPNGFDPVSRGMLNQYSIKNLLAQFNHLCKCSHKYLGGTMTAKYFNSSRPNYEWLNRFTIDSSSRIVYEENIIESVTFEHIKFFQLWLDNFFKSGSSIIKGFEKLI